MKVATYNIRGCRGLDNRVDCERIARILGEMDADIVALQEVQSYEVIKSIATESGYFMVEGPTVQKNTGNYGNALLGKKPFRSHRTHEISVEGQEPRGVLEAVIRFANGNEVRVFATHLGLKKSERRQQVDRILQSMDESVEMGTILMGDFNEWWPLGYALARIHERMGYHKHVRSFPARLPFLILDRIWTSGPLRVENLRAHRSHDARRASDHLPVVCDIGLYSARDEK